MALVGSSFLVDSPAAPSHFAPGLLSRADPAQFLEISDLSPKFLVHRAVEIFVIAILIFSFCLFFHLVIQEIPLTLAGSQFLSV